MVKEIRRLHWRLPYWEKSVYLLPKAYLLHFKGCKPNKEKNFERDHRDMTDGNMTIVIELFKTIQIEGVTYLNRK